MFCQNRCRHTKDNTSLQPSVDIVRLCYRDIPSWRDSIHNTLPNNWTILQFTLIDELSFQSCSGPLLLITKVTSGSDPETKIISGFTNNNVISFCVVNVSFPQTGPLITIMTIFQGISHIEKFDDILVENIQSVKTTSVRSFWVRRAQLNSDMEVKYIKLLDTNNIFY